jgi:hypothetical protein
VACGFLTRDLFGGEVFVQRAEERGADTDLACEARGADGVFGVCGLWAICGALEF